MSDANGVVESPTLRMHADGRVEIEWTHGRGPTLIDPEVLEEAVAAINDRAARDA